METLKILHIATDNKFLDYALPSFTEVNNTQNTAWVISETSALEYTQSPVDRVLKAKALTRQDVKPFDAFVLHSFRDFLSKFVLTLPLDRPIVWIGWGFDYYDLIMTNTRPLLLPITRRFHDENLSRKSLHRRVLSIIRERQAAKNLNQKIKAIRRIDYFAPVLESEYAAILTARPDLSLPQFISWNYGTIEDQYALNIGGQWVTGNNILLGNSATLTSNHLDAFQIIAEVGIKPDQILYIPLSYGDAGPEYTREVCRQAHAQFGENSYPITEFMPIESYLKLLMKCGFVIMNHIRQQAMGNIVSALYMGARIFLRRESPAYKTLASEGFVVNHIEQLVDEKHLLNTPLSSSEKINNRSLALEKWGRARATANTHALVQRLKIVGEPSNIR